MITQNMRDFSSVALSRRRKPYFIQRLQCWYFKDAAGNPYRLHSDEQRAHEMWRAIMGPEPESEPVIVPGVTERSTKPVTIKPTQPATPKPAARPAKPKPSKPARPKRKRLSAAVAKYLDHDYDKQVRIQTKTIRILKLIDLLAGFRFPKHLDEIHALITDAMELDWHPRTTERDLYVLESLGMLEVSRQGFKLNLARSERLQTVALAMFE